MARQIIISSLIVLVTMVVVTVLAWGALAFHTANPGFLDRSQLPVATATAEASVAGNNLDAALDGPSSQNSAVQQQARIDQLRRDTAKGLQAGLMRAMIFAGIVALVWTVGTCVRSTKVGGMSGMRSGRPTWAMGMIAVIIVSMAIAWLIFRTGGPAAAVSGTQVYPMTGLGLGLAMFAYYLATALAAPVEMRTSVPLATLFIHPKARRTSR